MSPILLAALGGLLTERAGIFNMALEGLMLTGSFAAVVATSWTGDPADAGCSPRWSRRWLVALVFGIVVVDLAGDAIVAGLAINLFALGATTFLMRAIFGVQGGYYDPAMPGLRRIELPLLAQVPVLGPDVRRPDHPGVGRRWRSWACSRCCCSTIHSASGCGPWARTPWPPGSVGVRVRRVQYLAVLGSGCRCAASPAHSCRWAS